MTNISKTIADKQLKELGVVEEKPVFVPSTKTVGELYDEAKKPRRTTRRTKISQQPSLFRNEPWQPITGRNQGGFEKSPKTWAKDDVLAKLDEHGKAITEHGEHAIIPSKRFDAIVNILWTDLINGMEQARMIVKPSLVEKFKQDLSFFVADSYFKGKDGEYKDIISREVDDE
tara:strand:+ start:294 stop:812 length:519 start_codon:yes stop_codon:yes gene_type:complete